MQKYRPYERVFTVPLEESDSEQFRVKRREIVIKWFKYAFQFIKFKHIDKHKVRKDFWKNRKPKLIPTGEQPNYSPKCPLLP